MTITIEYQGRRYIWRSGDDVADLEALIANLQLAINEAKQASAIALAPQLPIQT